MRRGPHLVQEIEPRDDGAVLDERQFFRNSRRLIQSRSAFTSDSVFADNEPPLDAILSPVIVSVKTLRTAANVPPQHQLSLRHDLEDLAQIHLLERQARVDRRSRADLREERGCE